MVRLLYRKAPLRTALLTALRARVMFTSAVRQRKKGDAQGMIEHIKKNSGPETKKVDQELSDADLAKVAGGIPPRAGGTGAEI